MRAFILSNVNKEIAVYPTKINSCFLCFPSINSLRWSANCVESFVSDIVMGLLC